MKQQEKEKEYETYVKEKTPVRKPGPAMAKAFVTGGSTVRLDRRS